MSDDTAKVIAEMNNPSLGAPYWKREERKRKAAQEKAENDVFVRQAEAAIDELQAQAQRLHIAARSAAILDDARNRLV